MHKSRFAGIIIDCRTDDLDGATDFWSAALGLAPKPDLEPNYTTLDTRPDEPYVQLQKVTHESRVHLDIETDDIPAEVARLEALGARKIADVRDWCVMEAPTGQRFCVVPALRPDFDAQANRWS
ncbi:MAG TPA: VOC family protein [Woeseiaceae bacterium]|nr:VOC family protein [Woeseiaceae bacterium]